MGGAAAAGEQVSHGICQGATVGPRREALGQILPDEGAVYRFREYRRDVCRRNRRRERLEAGECVEHL